MKTTNKPCPPELSGRGTLLAIDTSQKIMTVVLLDGSKSIFKSVEGEKNHSALLLPAIDSVLKEAELSVGEIEYFSLVTGPGSFTGLRVGLATLKGLLFGRNASVITVNPDELQAYYTSGDADGYFTVLKQKMAEGKFISVSEVELLYENPETKRFKY